VKEAINKIDWQAALDGTRPVTTRDGKKVTLYCVDAPGEWPIHGRIEGMGSPLAWMASGRALPQYEIAQDLIQPPPPPKPFKHEFWMNVYPDHVVGRHDTRKSADALAQPDRIACVRVVVEGYEGDGL